MVLQPLFINYYKMKLLLSLTIAGLILSNCSKSNNNNSGGNNPPPASSTDTITAWLTKADATALLAKTKCNCI